MTLPFFSQHGGQRGASAAPAPELSRDADPADEGEDQGMDDAQLEGHEQVDLDTEVPAARWAPIDLCLPPGFQVRDFALRPRRFVDGKDVGLVVAALRAPQGYPVPVRLSQIGAVVLGEEDGVLRRQAELVERAVTFITQPFAWHEIEALAIALQEHEMRLVHAREPIVASPVDLWSYGLARKVTFNASNNQMKQLEEGLAAQFYDDVPTVIDGRLEPRFGERTQRTAAVGVIKSHQARYLHALGLQVRYALCPRQRTPLFSLCTGSFPVVSWYLRFQGGLPDQGVVRVELPRGYFEAIPPSERRAYVDQLSATLHAYRCRQEDYGRAAVSLHPIVRAEESLGALMQPMNRLVSRFYRLSGL